MRIGVLYSGGKDSNYALHIASQHFEVSCLISIISKSNESYMFHVPNIHFVDFQAKALELPIIKKETFGEKEKELEDLKKAIEEAINKYEIEGVVTGAIRSIYQASRIQKICKELDIWCFNPIWLKDEIQLLNEIVNSGIKALITGVFFLPLGEDLIGKFIDKKTIEKLKNLKKYGINPAGEGGEFETFVLDSPLFKKRIEIKDYKIIREQYSCIMKIKSIALFEK